MYCIDCYEYKSRHLWLKLEHGIGSVCVCERERERERERLKVKNNYNK